MDLMGGMMSSPAQQPVAQNTNVMDIFGGGMQPTPQPVEQSFVAYEDSNLKIEMTSVSLQG